MKYNIILTPDQWRRMRPKMRESNINYEPSWYGTMYGTMIYISGVCSPTKYNIIATWVEEL